MPVKHGLTRFGAPTVVAQSITLAFAGLCGWLVALSGAPAGWLSGAIMGVALLAILNLAHPFAAPVRWIAMILSGVAIGSAVTPAMAQSFARYPASLALMFVSVVAITFICATLLERGSGWSRSTALLSSVPGALSYVFAIATTVDSADVRRIAVVQVLRVVLLMGFLPLILVESGVHAVLVVGIIDPLSCLIVTAGLGAAIGFGLERLGLAGGLLFGAMLASGFAHYTGYAPGSPPFWVTMIAQICIGAWIGARFIGFDWGLLARSIVAALGSFLVSVAVSTSFALAASLSLSIPFAQTLVAFAPGGLEAMTLLAFALGVDPLYVGVHHLARFLLISATLPLAMRLWMKPHMPNRL